MKKQIGTFKTKVGKEKKEVKFEFDTADNLKEALELFEKKEFNALKALNGYIKIIAASNARYALLNKQFCNKCKIQIPKGFKFCGSCGTKIT